MTANNGIDVMRKIITICLGFLLINCATALAQGMDDLSVDELYEKARAVAFDDGDYEAARKYAYEALDRSPDYPGIRIFVAIQLVIMKREELSYGEGSPEKP